MRLLLLCAATAARIGWDPPELPPRWWEQRSDSAPPAAPAAAAWACDALERSATVYALDGAYGQLNNVLRQIVGLARLAVHNATTAGAIVVPQRWRRFAGAHLELDGALHSWVCAFNKTGEVKRRGYRVRKLRAQQLFEAEHARMREAGGWFAARVLGAILRRPSAAVRERVGDFEQRVASGLPYVGVHLRALDGECEAKMRRHDGMPRTRPLARAAPHGGAPRAGGGSADSESAAGAFGPGDVCRMSEEYVDAFLRSEAARAADDAVRALPLYLAHDGAQPERVRALGRRWRVLERNVTRGRARRLDFARAQDVVVDMLLLLRARAFIGVPVSSLANNVALVRALLMTTSNASQNIERYVGRGSGAGSASAAADSSGRRRSPRSPSPI